jgi:hypothetical protein
MRNRFALLMLSGCAAACANHPTAEQNAIVADIERRVVLPRGAGDLKCYERYYLIANEADQKRLYGVALSGKRVVLATYVAGKKPGVRWIDSADGFPDLQDAGCGKLSAVYIVGDPAFPVEAACAPDLAGRIGNVVDPPVTC